MLLSATHPDPLSRAFQRDTEHLCQRQCSSGCAHRMVGSLGSGRSLRLRTAVSLISRPDQATGVMRRDPRRSEPLCCSSATHGTVCSTRPRTGCGPSSALPPEATRPMRSPGHCAGRQSGSQWPLPVLCWNKSNTGRERASVCACVSVHMAVHVRVYMCPWVSVSVSCLCMCLCLCVCVNRCTCVFVCVCVYMCASMSVYVCQCLCVRVLCACVTVAVYRASLSISLFVYLIRVWDVKESKE